MNPTPLADFSQETPKAAETEPDRKLEVTDLDQAPKVHICAQGVHDYVRDPSDETDAYYAEICRSCPVGRLVRKA